MTRLIKAISEMRGIVDEAKNRNMTVGLVPTMGYLHDGHKSLIVKSKHDNDITIVSIFINPIQFGKGEDLDNYPCDIEHDMSVVKNVKAEYVFFPENKMMYPENYDTFVNVGGVTQDLCGGSRPDHFRGVATVVLKLFNICRPDRAYFGQKDYQQSVVIKKMTRELDLFIEIIVCPIIRENDGLAMSSRNTYLAPEGRKAAAMIYKALQRAEDAFEKGEKKAKVLSDIIFSELNKEPLINSEYVEVRDAHDLKKIETVKSDAVIAVAARIGKTRLIDNILIKGVF